jgi:N-acetylglucosaminyldiphosphoundecaprenol N-acetyl-beta-D-mannosaminyltransferase
MLKTVVFGITIQSFQRKDLISAALNILETQRQARICSANIHNLNLAYKNTRLKQFFNSNEIIYCDGLGALIAFWLKKGQKYGARQASLDIIFPFIEEVIKHHYRIFILGGKPGVAEKAASVLENKYPTIQIAGTHHGFFDLDHPSASHKVASRISYLQTDILFVGMGVPLQEYWVEKWGSQTGARLIWCVGSLFDVIAGEKTRGPDPFINCGLEWLTRLLKEPKRLWRRYLIGIPVFLLRLIADLTRNNTS